MLDLFNFFKKELSVQEKKYVKNHEAYLALPRKTRKTLEMLWGYELPPALIKKLKKKFPFNTMSDQEIATCVDEFKKFMAIMVIGRNKKKGVAMTSNLIDEVWHQFILFTMEYQKFSEMLNGKFIHHTPNTEAFSFGPDAAKFFYSAYKEYFGDLNPIWHHTIIEDEFYQNDSSKDESQSLLPALNKKQIEKETKSKNLVYVTKFQISKKEKLRKSPICGKSAGFVEDSGSSTGTWGIACGAFTTGFTAADGSGVSDLGGCGGGDGCGGGCGGCGG